MVNIMFQPVGLAVYVILLFFGLHIFSKFLDSKSKIVFLVSHIMLCLYFSYLFLSRMYEGPEDYSIFTTIHDLFTLPKENPMSPVAPLLFSIIPAGYIAFIISWFATNSKKARKNQKQKK